MNENNSLVSLEHVRRAAGLGYDVELRPNPNYTSEHERNFVTWDYLVQLGKEYLVGDKMPLAEFLEKYTSRLNTWQSLAALWAQEHPEQALLIESSALCRGPERCYVVCTRAFADPNGPCVEIGLPYHGQGGEKHWITRNAKTRVLINVD